MATLGLSQSQSVPGAITGVNVDPNTFYAWDLKALFPSAAASDVIETPIVDLNGINPKANRLNLQKVMTNAGTDTLKLLVSNDGTNWYTAPVFNGGTAGGLAVANPSAAEVGLVGLPSMRFVKGQLILAAAMSTQTVSRLSLALMRF